MTATQPGKVVLPQAYHTVGEFVREHERWEGPDSHIRTTGEHGTNTHRLSLTSRTLNILLSSFKRFAEQLEAERVKVHDLRIERDEAANESAQRGTQLHRIYLIVESKQLIDSLKLERIREILEESF